MDETTMTRNPNGYGYPGARWQPEDLEGRTEWPCSGGTCDRVFSSSDAEFFHDCPRLGSTFPTPRIATRRSDNVDAPERHEGSGHGSSRSPERTNRYAGSCVRCGHRVAAETGLLVKDNSAVRGGSVWGVEHRRGDCPDTPAPVEASKPKYRPNKYAGTCTTCRGPVAEAAGRIEKQDGRWLVFHLDGECAVTGPAPTPTEQPDVPAGHYAIESSGHNDLVFYRVDRPTEGAYAGRVFVKMIIGGHPDQNVARSHVTGILARISQDPDAAARYGQELGRCCRCNRTLTDETSRALGIGPECRSK